MKKFILFAFAVFASAVVYAQPGGMGGPGGGMMPMMGGASSSYSLQDPEEQAKTFVEKMKDSLQLDDKQFKTLVKLYTNHYTKLQNLKAQISDLEKYTEQRLTTEILTTDQATKWKTVKKSLQKSLRGDNNNFSNNQNGMDMMFPGGGMMPPMGGGPGGGGPGMM